MPASIRDRITDKLPIAAEELEQLRPGIIDRIIDEVITELGWPDEPFLSNLQKIYVATAAALKLAQSALDFYKAKETLEAADDVRTEHANIANLLKEKIYALQQELEQLSHKVSEGGKLYKVVKV